MELRVNEVAIPEKIDFNYEELKAELTSKVSFYETLVYTDDQIKDAKADKANLNKLKRALNDERIRREKEYMQPFNVFKAQINEIIPCNKQTAEAWGISEGDLFKCNPYLQIRCVDGSHSMWVPSINDCLAEDWVIVE